LLITLGFRPKARDCFWQPLLISGHIMLKTYIYIDGFNLYYGALKNTPYRWRNLKSLFEKLLGDEHKIEAIKYFTAIVSEKNDPKKPIRQQTYIRALKKYIPEISVYFGLFKSHIVAVPLAFPTETKKFEKIIKTEEKGSDVNLAIHLLNDAWLNKYDCAVVLSNDSDLAEAIRLVKVDHKKTIDLILPGDCFSSKKLINFADFVKRIRKGPLADSQLPTPIPGTSISEPIKWKIEAELHKQNRLYTNLLIIKSEEISQSSKRINISFRYKKDYFTGQVLIEKDKLKLEKIEKFYNKSIQQT